MGVSVKDLSLKVTFVPGKKTGTHAKHRVLFSRLVVSETSCSRRQLGPVPSWSQPVKKTPPRRNRADTAL